MPNVIKSATTVSNGTIKRNNFLIGVNTSVDYGPTASTGFWSGIVPPTSGYTVYAQKESQGPSIRVASNDSELITIARQYGGTNINTANDALNFFNSQSNFLVTNIDYEDIITDGLALLLDAGYVPSYPRSGTTWSDLSGNGFFATTQGTVPFTSAGGLSYFTFNGTAGNYFLGNLNLGSVITGTSGITISSIFSTSDVSVRSTLLSNYAIQGGYGFECGTASGLWTNTLRSFIASNTSSDRRGTTSVLSNNVIYIMTVTWNQVTKISTLYLNGSEISSTEVSDPSFLNTVWANPSGAVFEVGASTFFSLYATGNIYKTMVYNRPLSSTEILRNYNAQKSRFGI
jgi:hypothetical protein